VNHEYREGLFREFDVGQRNDSIPDGDNRFWRRDREHRRYDSPLSTCINDQNNQINFNAFVINKVFEETYEAGREGGAIIFEELTPEEAGNQFVRDQNLKNTLLNGSTAVRECTKFSDKNELGLGHLVTTVWRQTNPTVFVMRSIS
jgi:hypothetical protein